MTAFRKFTRPEGRERITRCGGETARRGLTTVGNPPPCWWCGFASELLTRIKYWRVSCRSVHATPRRDATPRPALVNPIEYSIMERGRGGGEGLHTYVVGRSRWNRTLSLTRYHKCQENILRNFYRELYKLCVSGIIFIIERLQMF